MWSLIKSQVTEVRLRPLHAFGCGDSLTNKRDFCPPPCAMYVPCCSIRAVSTAQATPDQHPEQTQIEQRPDFGNIAKRQTRPSPTQSTFSVDGALPGRRCAILAGSMHSPRLAGQIGGARTEQGRGGGEVRSGRLRVGVDMVGLKWSIFCHSFFHLGRPTCCPHEAKADRGAEERLQERSPTACY